MHATRHPIVLQPLSAAGAAKLLLDQATTYEEAGNWYLAGEAYRELAKAFDGEGVPEDLQARALARAASAFEISGQSRPAARAYFDAASILENKKIDHQAAGEFFNRAALLFRSIAEYFPAGDAWRRAADSFGHMNPGTVTSTDNLAPVPWSASNFTIAGACFTAAGDAFMLSGDNAKWACRSYWESGQMYARNEYGGYHAFVAYKKALLTAIDLYRTHDRTEMRKYLPMSDAEREARLDPVAVMEAEYLRSNIRHRAMNRQRYDETWPTLQIDREMVTVYHEFYLRFLAIGNVHEAEACRRAKMERLRRLFVAEKRLRAATLYGLWKVTAGYGESLGRWALTCFAVLATFSTIYAVGDLLEPVTSWFDYVYFSVVTFTSLGYGDVHPVGIVGKIVASSEILVGLVLFGLLLSLIANRAQRTGPGA